MDSSYHGGGWVAFGLAVGGWCHFVIRVGETYGHIMSKIVREIQKLISLKSNNLSKIK